MYAIRSYYDGEADAVHRQQPAEAHAEVADLQQGAHVGSSICGRRLGSSPWGRQTIISTMTRPKISMRYSYNFV